jgi:hypothetical protein
MKYVGEFIIGDGRIRRQYDFDRQPTENELRDLESKTGGAAYFVARNYSSGAYEVNLLPPRNWPAVCVASSEV